MSEQVPAPAAYTALALQVRTRSVNASTSVEDARATMRSSIDHIGARVRSSKAFVQQYNGTDVRLVVLPEYCLTGFPMGESIADWQAKAALDPAGPEYEALAAIAWANDVFLCGNVYETDEHFPGFYFQACFVIAPSGDTVLRYRRLISLYAPAPYDVWDRFLDRYGLDGVFPVADTEIGRLAAIASEEILYPEIARCLMLRGAEVFLHPTSEVGSPRPTPKAIARQARAVENLAYVVSSNTAALDEIPFPAASTSGMSAVIDPHGHVLAEANPGGESMVAHALVELRALREARRRTGLTNTISRLPLQAFADTYRDHVVRPANRLLDADGQAVTPERGQMGAWQAEDIAALAARGRI